MVLPSRCRMYLSASPSSAHLPSANETLVKRSGPFVLIRRINGFNPRCSLKRVVKSRNLNLNGVYAALQKVYVVNTMEISRISA